jgi:hypothetical protein
MTQQNRSLILGRPPEEENAIRRDLDRQFFGERDAPVPSEPVADTPPRASVKIAHRAPAANDTTDEEELVPRQFRERAGDDRRRGSRRLSDYKPLDKSKARNDGNGHGVLMTVGAIGVTLIFVVAVWQAYSQGVRTSDEEAIAPLLTATGPFKVRPEDDKGEGDVAASASVFERMEAPAAKPAAVAPVAEVAAAEPVPAENDMPAADARPQPVIDERPLPPPIAAAPAVAPPVKAAPAKVEPALPAAAVQLPAVKPAPSPAPVLAGGSASAFKPVFAAGGPFSVQLAAAGSEADANSEWDRRRRLAPELFAGAEKIIAKAEVNGRTVYRARVGSFGSAADADGFCNAFKAKGGDCFRAVK